MKKETLRQITALLLATAMMASLSGCAVSGSSSTAVDQKDEKKVDMMSSSSSAASVAAQIETEELESEINFKKNEADELGLTEQQLNSFSMLYYLTITADEIRTAKNNRLVLDDIYTSLLNDINPGAIDETTQDHLTNLRDVIKNFLGISQKRERLQYLYNQDKASAIRSAVPNPIAVLSVAQTMNWAKLAMAVVYTVVDSYNSYKSAEKDIDQDFLMSGWELDDEETETIQKTRERAFDYMVDMVQAHDLDGMLTLNEEAVTTFTKISAMESVPQKLRLLEAEEKTYRLLGDYWLERADCYYQTERYRECLDCIARYKSLSTGIYRKDHSYVQMVPKAVAAAQQVYTGSEYITEISAFADDIMNNTSSDEWSLRYFAAQAYLDLYARTGNRSYLETAYNTAYDNVAVLLDEQRKLNDTYLADFVEETIEEPDYSMMTDEEKKEAKKSFKEEKKRLKQYNKEQKERRKTELPPLYQPLILNCDLLFALADEMKITLEEKEEIKALLEVDTNGIFLSKPVNDKYTFSEPKPVKEEVILERDEIVIPANLLMPEASFVVTAKDKNRAVTFNDCVIDRVEREGESLDSFRVHITSKQMGDYEWTEDSQVTIQIFGQDGFAPLTFQFKVKEYKDNWFLADKVVFEQT